MSDVEDEELSVSISNIHAAAAVGVTYAASKAALESVTKSLAQDLGKKVNEAAEPMTDSHHFSGHDFGATVNAVNPGPVRTQM